MRRTTNYEQGMHRSLKNMDPGKTPGTDGFPAQFYKVFWLNISIASIAALNFAFNNVSQDYSTKLA